MTMNARVPLVKFEYQSYKKQYGDRKKFHRALGVQQITARRHVIWLLLAHQGNSMVSPGVATL